MSNYSTEEEHYYIAYCICEVNVTNEKLAFLFMDKNWSKLHVVIIKNHCEIHRRARDVVQLIKIKIMIINKYKQDKKYILWFTN